MHVARVELRHGQPYRVRVVREDLAEGIPVSELRVVGINLMGIDKDIAEHLAGPAGKERQILRAAPTGLPINQFLGDLSRFVADDFYAVVAIGLGQAPAFVDRRSAVGLNLLEPSSGAISKTTGNFSMLSFTLILN